MPLGFLSISIVCAALMTDNQKEEKNKKRREAYQRGKVSAALLTDEQREEKNRKWREAYKRKKCHAHNKKNILGLHMFKLTVGLLCLSHIVHGYVNYYFI